MSFPANVSAIAPFWADVDTRNGGTVWYGEKSSNRSLLSRAEGEVRSYFSSIQNFVPNFLFVATWENVPHFNQQIKVRKNINTSVIVIMKSTTSVLVKKPSCTSIAPLVNPQCACTKVTVLSLSVCQSISQSVRQSLTHCDTQISKVATS